MLESMYTKEKKEHLSLEIDVRYECVPWMSCAYAILEKIIGVVKWRAFPSTNFFKCDSGRYLPPFVAFSS